MRPFHEIADSVCTLSAATLRELLATPLSPKIPCATLVRESMILPAVSHKISLYQLSFMVKILEHIQFVPFNEDRIDRETRLVFWRGDLAFTNINQLVKATLGSVYILQLSVELIDLNYSHNRLKNKYQQSGITVYWDLH
jgi:hypothetical protein